ncbi:glycosyltransferase family 2 protein [Marine Group I thaumarchaeote]|uniref:Glycosyltransferase family 2 protein n=1 Tax=Marine Group I thaumarchaeote TaxID=2511932 RepID=A0A7K4NKI0_9ARCH|nr:glycosyltransferase family 2 protein [Marine Group I thaumarchaeote]
MSITIIILTLDEIDGVSTIMPQINKNWAEEIVFVDGGSTDGTVEKAKELGFDVIHQKNKGEGNACRIGTDATQSDYIMFFSPDGNDLPEDIPKLIEKTKQGHDVVHISRFGKNSISNDANWFEYFGNKMFTFLVNSFFGGNYTDALNGFRIIKRTFWDELKTDAQYLNIEQQTCIRLAKRKIPIYEIESREPDRIGGERKMRPLTVGAQLSYQIIKEFIFWK